MKILIVDDEKPLVKSTSTYLKTKGYGEIHTLTDSRLVIDYILAEKPDVILLDLNMPYLTGTELVHSIKQLKIQIHIIIISAIHDMKVISKVNKLGIDDFLIKPINSQYLINSLKKIES